MARNKKIIRKTTETDVSVEINLDGEGTGNISTTIPFLDHMLNLFAKHGFIDLNVKGSGDTDVDYHHLVEDIGICLGEAVKGALGNKKGVSRYGTAFVPMDETLCHVCIDISGRPYLVFRADFGGKKIRDFDPILLEEFFKSFSDHGGITLHVNVIYGKNPHHIAEAIFKAFARALRNAVCMDNRIKDVLSTKGII
ncbi:MAG: imidazoleglycerol-phosphate dehydratase HisB [Deltaproteobacteria bacterium]|nr:imidazoleglycerol-phosphate dehydratase HisB [Deltaproteobacteria bacterium]MBW2648366.1 imidazoleglycerol-phosphate dehydratase HisB [Deltaproteobacteria bacterium]